MQHGGIPAVTGSGEVFALLDDAQPRPDGHVGDLVSRLYTDFAFEKACSDPTQLDVFWDSVEADVGLGLHAVFAIDYEWGVALHAVTVGRHLALGIAGEGAEDTQPAFRVLLFRALALLTAQQVDDWLAQAEANALAVTPPTACAPDHPSAPLQQQPLRDAVSQPAPAPHSEALPPLPSHGAPPSPAPAGIVDVQHSVTAAQFEQAISQIQAALGRGDCYQINYTFRLTFGIFGHPLSLYRRLRARQPAAYGALIHTARGWTLSASPELFVRHRAGHMLVQPMKGTAKRDNDPIRDAAIGAALQADPKNRAENVMIVDLLRNDVSKLAIPGGVCVEKLFAVQAWPTLWQMTSSVAATLRPEVRFPDVLRALYPCGSITGAPKHAAMRLISALETTPRSIYTGAIGWFDASGPSRSGVEADPRVHRCGNFCLSVAIRTVTIDTAGQGKSAVTEPSKATLAQAIDAAVALAPKTFIASEAAFIAVDAREKPKMSCGRVGIGAGIVLDSDAPNEHAECLLKARFLTDADPGFTLIETMLAEEASADAQATHAGFNHYLPLRTRHLDRLAASSARLGFRFDHAAVNGVMDHMLKSIRVPGPHRLRLTLSKQGRIDCSVWPLQPLERDAQYVPSGSDVSDVRDAQGAQGGAVKILLANDYGFGPIGSNASADAFLLGFKTTHRAHYDRAWQRAETEGAFDLIFTNAAGNLTEGARSNLLLKLDGAWWTPPVIDGLLPGVMRGALMDNADWRVRERRMTVNDLICAEALAVCNALRGVLPAVLQAAST